MQDATPLPPLANPKRLFYAAANYSDHVAGMTKTFTSALPTAGEARAPLRPYLFVKACAMTGANDDIVLPPGMKRIDWEAELAVVIGRPGKRIAPEAVERAYRRLHDDQRRLLPRSHLERGPPGDPLRLVERQKLRYLRADGALVDAEGFRARA